MGLLVAQNYIARDCNYVFFEAIELPTMLHPAAGKTTEQTSGNY